MFLNFQMEWSNCLLLILFDSSYLSMGITSNPTTNQLVMRSSYNNSNTTKTYSFLQLKNLSPLPQLLLIFYSIQDSHNKHFLLKSHFSSIHSTSPSLFTIFPYHPITPSIHMIFFRTLFL